jgi:hypothetical protein
MSHAFQMLSHSTSRGIFILLSEYGTGDPRVSFGVRGYATWFEF